MATNAPPRTMALPLPDSKYCYSAGLGQVDPTRIHSCLEEAPLSGVESWATGWLLGSPQQQVPALTVAYTMSPGSFSVNSLPMPCFEEMVSVSLLYFETPEDRTRVCPVCSHSTLPTAGAQDRSRSMPWCRPAHLFPVHTNSSNSSHKIFCDGKDQGLPPSPHPHPEYNFGP